MCKILDGGLLRFYMERLIVSLLIVMRVIFVVLNVKPPSGEFWAHYRYAEPNTPLLLQQVEGRGKTGAI